MDRKKTIKNSFLDIDILYIFCITIFYMDRATFTYCTGTWYSNSYRLQLHEMMQLDVGRVRFRFQSHTEASKKGTPPAIHALKMSAEFGLLTALS